MADIVKAPPWDVEIDNCTLSFTHRKSQEIYKKTYGSNHAAKCAIGRLKYDHAVATAIVTNIKIKALKPSHDSRGLGGRGRLKSDWLLALALDKLSQHEERDIEEVIEKFLDDSVELFRKEDHKLAHHTAVRQAIGERNKELGKEYVTKNKEKDK